MNIYTHISLSLSHTHTRLSFSSSTECTSCNRNGPIQDSSITHSVMKMKRLLKTKHAASAIAQSPIAYSRMRDSWRPTLHATQSNASVRNCARQFVAVVTQSIAILQPALDITESEMTWSGVLIREVMRSEVPRREVHYFIRCVCVCVDYFIRCLVLWLF